MIQAIKMACGLVDEFPLCSSERCEPSSFNWCVLLLSRLLPPFSNMSFTLLETLPTQKAEANHLVGPLVGLPNDPKLEVTYSTWGKT